jgi:hypothetical protein
MLPNAAKPPMSLLVACAQFRLGALWVLLTALPVQDSGASDRVSII